MYLMVGHEFNLNSFEAATGYPVHGAAPATLPSRTKSGYSTDAASLEGLKAQLDTGRVEGADPRAYDVLNGILEYRQLSKIKSTYVDALPGLVNPETPVASTPSTTRRGRRRGAYRRTTRTCRTSRYVPSSGAVCARRSSRQDAPEWTLLAADYSQIELRILAHFSGDPALLRAFHEGKDIHNATSSLVYDVPIDEVTDDMRRIAKVLNFGVLYGVTAFGISRQTDLTPEQGQRFINTYFEQYPGTQDYVDNTIQTCRSKSDTCRRCWADDGTSPTSPRATCTCAARRSGRRSTCLYRGPRADIIKIAMIRIMERMTDLGMRSKMILQVHDELIFETPRDELEGLTEVVMELMPASLSLAVPLGGRPKDRRHLGRS